MHAGWLLGRGDPRSSTNAVIGARGHNVSQDVFWLKGDTLEETENLADPDVLAEEIVENLVNALALATTLLAMITPAH